MRWWLLFVGGLLLEVNNLLVDFTRNGASGRASVMVLPTVVNLDVDVVVGFANFVSAFRPPTEVLVIVLEVLVGVGAVDAALVVVEFLVPRLLLDVGLGGVGRLTSVDDSGKDVVLRAKLEDLDEATRLVGVIKVVHTLGLSLHVYACCL